ncbi:MAG: enoyl-CoA hydratase [Frankia sp.]
MSEWQLIRLDSSEDGVRLLTLDDPARHNAISVAMREELVDCAARLRADPDARVLVVTGAGRSFCSGADLLEVLGGPERDVLEMRNSLRDVYASFLELRALPIPTIAAVQGHAIGAGLNVAMSCDIRLAGPGARFGATFTRIGLHPGGGCTYFLTSALGPQRALQILLDGATLTGEEAVRVGLALSLHDDPLAEALSMARRFAGVSPELARDIKATVRLAEKGLDASLGYETWAQAATATQPRIWETLRGPRG